VGGLVGLGPSVSRSLVASSTSSLTASSSGTWNVEVPLETGAGKEGDVGAGADSGEGSGATTIRSADLGIWSLFRILHSVLFV
jgi:hypothetical protein